MNETLQQIVAEMRERVTVLRAIKDEHHNVRLLENWIERLSAIEATGGEVVRLLDEFDTYTRDKIGNCSDRHCMLGENAVGTNGGCRCWDDRRKARWYMTAARQLHRNLRVATPPPPRDAGREAQEASRYRWLRKLKSGRPESQIALAQVILALREKPEAMDAFIDEQIAKDRALAGGE